MTDDCFFPIACNTVASPELPAKSPISPVGAKSPAIPHRRAAAELSWTPEPTPHCSGYFYVVPKDCDTWLDGSPEVVYLYFNGRYSVIRPGEQKHQAIADFSHWYGPLSLPDLPAEIEAMLDSED